MFLSCFVLFAPAILSKLRNALIPQCGGCLSDAGADASVMITPHSKRLKSHVLPVQHLAEQQPSLSTLSACLMSYLHITQSGKGRHAVCIKKGGRTWKYFYFFMRTIEMKTEGGTAYELIWQRKYVTAPLVTGFFFFFTDNWIQPQRELPYILLRGSQLWLWFSRLRQVPLWTPMSDPAPPLLPNVLSSLQLTICWERSTWQKMC